MTRGRLLVLLLCVAIALTGLTLLSLKLTSDRTERILKMDKRNLEYNYAKNILKKGMSDRAAGIFVALVKSEPGTLYEEGSLRNLGNIFYDRSDYQKAGYYYRQLLKNFPNVGDAAAVRKKLEDFGVKELVTKTNTPDSMEYVVQKGDSLYTIAKKFKTTVELLKMANGLQGEVLRVGQGLKVNVSKLSIYVIKSKNIMILKKDGEPFKTYPVATGKNNSTPVGVFTITDKVVRSPWTRPDGTVLRYGDPGYELGERWMAISAKGYGLHGTSDETSIGKQITGGCVRMHNKDVIELYDIVPVGTEVEIRD